MDEISMEPNATALLLAVFGLLMVFSVLFTRTLDRMGVPVVLLFLIVGMLGGSEGLLGVEFDDYDLAYRLGTVALVLILFDGGLSTTYDSIRKSAGPAGVLATVGVAGTAAVLALVGWLAGLSWTQAALIGAIVSSTDAAAVFAVLRGGSLRVKEKVRSLLEIESCANDPMAIILTFAVVESLRVGESPGWRLLLEVPLQLVIGTLVGTGCGFGCRRLLSRTVLMTVGLYPVITLATAFFVFGVATICHGSGLLAVYAAAVVLGNGPLPHRGGLTRVHDAFAWLSQVSMFLMLGLLVFPSRLLPVAGVGLLLGLSLSLIARPLIVSLCLLPFRWPLSEIGYVSWVGIRGAVPIVLATVPVMSGVSHAESIFHVVFFIVVVSALVPGASIVPLTRRLRLDEPEPPAPAALLEVHSLRKIKGEILVFYIHPTLAVCNVPLSRIPFPEGSAAILVVRGDELLAARGRTMLQPGDHVYVFCKRGDEPYMALLFGRAAES